MQSTSEVKKNGVIYCVLLWLGIKQFHVYTSLLFHYTGEVILSEQE